MKRRLFFSCAMLLLNVFSINAQKKPTSKQVSAKNITEETVDAVDTLFAENSNADFPVKLVRKKPDGKARKLPDNAYAAQTDSLWLEELTNSYLYDSINKIVHDLDYSEIEYPELPTDTLKKRLADLNARTPFNVEYNPSLESVIKRYLKRHRPTMERMMGLSEFYFPAFEETLDKYDLPLELKYLAIVESALRPRAKSPVGATGLWQFMFSTGKLYNLDVSSYVDERMDPTLSTEAASQYLSKLYEVFGDWDLALASYNSGPGTVSKAIRRSGGLQNYWNIRHYLPRETAGYVPAFLATMYIFEYAKEHGYKPQKPEFNYFATDTVRVKETLTLDQVASYLNISAEEIQFLNPSYKLDVIPYVSNKPYYLRLPVQAIGTFVNNEEAIYATAKSELENREKALPEYLEIPESVTYRVRSGDYLGRIAERYGVGISQIKSWNNLKSNTLRVGQRLLIYPKKAVAASGTRSTSDRGTKAGEKKYIVQKGDSLWKIAQKFPGVSTENLKVWNDISGSGIKPGMTLVISR